MKKPLLIGLIVFVLILLATAGAAPIFAHDPADGSPTPDGDKAWQAMHEACQSGDWPAMAEAAEQAHGDDFDDMTCHDEDYHDSNNHWDGMGGHMSGGMMGW